MKTKLSHLLLVGILFTFSFCSSNESDWASDKNCGSDYKKFTNEFMAICYPVDWIVDSSGIMGSEVYFANNKTESLEGGRTFSQNINVMKQADADIIKMGLKNLDEYAVFSRKQIEKVLHEGKVLSFKKATVAGLPAYHNVMTSNQNGLDLFFEQYMVYKNNHYFILTYTAPIDASENDKKRGNSILNTIDFK